MADETHLYRTTLSWTSQRKGNLTSPGLPDLTVATPPEFPGGHEGVWSPEHLFVASAEACLMTTFLAIAENSKLEFASYSSSAEGKLEKTAEGYRITEITLYPKVVTKDASAVERAKRIVEKAEQHCLISNSMNSLIKLVPEVSAG
jgi:organic hydroperoxide reductase OsmC/OhrA